MRTSVTGALVIRVPQTGEYDERAMKTFVTTAVRHALAHINDALPMGVYAEQFTALSVTPYDEEKK